MTRPAFIACQGRATGEKPWQLIVPGSLWAHLHDHLFPGDHDEHGAVVTAGIVHTQRGTRLLARELILAEDGSDFVPSPNAHRRLTPEFVNRCIRHCRNGELAYLAIHNHGGSNRVAFSSVDMRSHERGYPALLDIARGQPVGALVIAEGAVAGDVWTPDRRRREIAETVILERNIRRLHPHPAAAPPAHREIDDRQVRVYGAAGQVILRRLKVGVIGAGGVGLPVSAALARLGIGHIVAIDPDRVEPSNLPRLPESTRLDAMTLLDAEGRPQWLRRLGRRLATPKVTLARRTAGRAPTDVVVDAIRGDVSDPAITRHLIDCDYLFLAADSHTARAVFNQLVHQYLVPGVQVGSKVELTPDGQLHGIYSIVRPVTPDRGCLWCNELISAARITEESLPDDIREAQRYVPADEAPAPSVGTLNALGVAQATNHFMLAATGLLRESAAAGDYRRFDALAERQLTEIPRNDPDCVECGLGARSIRARGSRA
jgi:ThiF family